MQDWTTLKCHSRESMDVFGLLRKVLGLAREKATVNEKVRFPRQNSNISVFETEARMTLHARTEYCRMRRSPRSRNPDFRSRRDVLQLWGTAVMSIRAEWASQAS